MKKLTTALALILATSAFTAANASDNCASKRAALEKQISIAQQYGNSYKVAGLKKGLAEVTAHCTNSSMLSDAQKDVSKLEKKLAEKTKDVNEVQADLKKAQARGDRQKIAKYQRKLTEKQNDVREVQQDLNQARAKLARLQK
ncbi:DUF1090 domain-containing protein [Scandinavium goeteborgense]|uniref:Uncharacterized protein DUF1090 n=1 Tax=Scandinavium goeteborgense TaxID=1851514 RepID=A0A4R6E192_SCAGO|nr:DUF1090 domain-containing protein [Scandinavium goeteborgense]TDN51477.1 uncharacterized protein DUF1090 [Scandinavium goeteborgense]